MFLSSFPLAAFNHVLAQEPWVRDRLVAHQGKIACVEAGWFALRLKVAPDGSLKVAATGAAANVTIRMAASDVPAMLRNRDRAMAYVKIEGDADFAQSLSSVAQALRWDVEADLSQWLGDIAAHRLVAGTKTVLATVKSTQQKLAENTAEYFLEEVPLLVRSHRMADFTSAVVTLRDDVERLTKRIEKLKTTPSGALPLSQPKSNA